MVYTTVSVIYGVILNRKEVMKLLEIDSEEDLDEFLFDDLYISQKVGSVDIKLYRFPCCSESKDEKWILGKEMHKYYRRFVEKCPDCGEYTYCDRCIGATDNGYYPVIEIFNQPIEVDIRHLCFNCFHDNRKDMGYRYTTAKIVNNRFLRDDYNPELIKRCEVCNIKSENIYRSPQDFMKFTYDFINRKLNTYGKNPKFYYMLNDCISCT